MKKLVMTGVAAAMLAVSAGALAQNLAIVNGKPVPKARVDALAQQLARSGRQVSPEMQGQLREEVINREILTQEAQARGLDSTEAYKAQIEMAKQAILINELFTEYLKNNPVTDAEIKAEYDKLVAANAGKEYRARHILVPEEKQAKDLIAQIKKDKSGKKFAELAKKFSKDPGSAKNGGDLDWSSPANYVPEFSNAMLALEKGKMTEAPVKSQFGFHIIQLDDVRDIKFPAFEEVKPQLAQQMPQQKIMKFREELRAKAKVE
ncbi:MAG: foldase protein PrsA [Rhodoferax sp.]